MKTNMLDFFKLHIFYFLIFLLQIEIYGGNNLDKSSTVVEQLKNMVGLHLEMHPNLSLNAISKRASVSGTTLRRIMNSANSSEPAPHVILNLVSYLY